jgi:hypothetical protein
MAVAEAPQPRLKGLSHEEIKEQAQLTTAELMHTTKSKAK